MQDAIEEEIEHQFLVKLHNSANFNKLDARALKPNQSIASYAESDKRAKAEAEARAPFNAIAKFGVQMILQNQNYLNRSYGGGPTGGPIGGLNGGLGLPDGMTGNMLA